MCDVSCVGNIYLLGGGVAGVAIVYIIGETIYIWHEEKMPRRHSGPVV